MWPGRGPRNVSRLLHRYRMPGPPRSCKNLTNMPDSWYFPLVPFLTADGRVDIRAIFGLHRPVNRLRWAFFVFVRIGAKNQVAAYRCMIAILMIHAVGTVTTHRARSVNRYQYTVCIPCRDASVLRLPRSGTETPRSEPQMTKSLRR